MIKIKESGPIRTAVAGLGRAGWNIHVKGLKNRTDFKIVACIDPEEERRKEAETLLGCRTYATWKEFIKEPGDTELAIIATASIMHVPMSIEALKKGLHVVTEKPMAVNLKEAATMIAAAKKVKTVFTVHQNHRCDAYLHHALSIMNSGLLGKVFFIKMTNNRFARRNDWQTLRKYGGGILNNYGSHRVDQAQQLMQAPVVDVWGDLQRTIWSGDAEDHFKVLLRGKNGRVIDIECSSACAVGQPSFMIMGSLGTLVMQGEESKEFYIKYLDPNTLPKLTVDKRLAVPGRKYGVQGGDVLQWQEKRVPAEPPEMEIDYYANLYQAIREGKPPLVKPAEVFEQMKILDRARKGTKFTV